GLDAETVGEALTKLRTMGAVRESNHGYELRLEGLRSAVESEMSARDRRKIHAAFYEALSIDKSTTEDLLATVAYKGGLWEQASVHFTKLAQLAISRGDYVSVLSLYESLKGVLRRLNQKLPLEAEIEMAISLAKIGKTRKAEQILQRSLTE